MGTNAPILEEGESLSAQTATASQTCRILYYGPMGAGKRENLRQISASIPAENRISLAVEDPERQIAFRLRSGGQGAWMVISHAIDTGREMFLGESFEGPAPFDGIVFVAHSASSRLDQNLSSWEALKVYLDKFGLDITSLPLVIQYNCRDEEGALPVDRLESLLNPWGLLSFPSNAKEGEGVKETLKAILSLTMSKLVQGSTDSPAPQAQPPSATQPQSPPKESVTMKKEEPSVTVSEPVFSANTDRADLQIVTDERSNVFYEDLRPPIVVPVRIPKRLLEKFGSARIILEIELDDSDTLLS
jgi:signal recognition particle receptor subunit beta